MTQHRENLHDDAIASKTQVRQMQAEDMPVWDQFVATCPEATFFHKAGWQSVIEQAFGHKTYFLVAEENGVIQGVLPLAEVKSYLFGHSLSALPFCVYGGVASDSEEVLLFLENQAIELAQQLSVDYLELRYPFARDNAQFTEKCAHSAFGCVLADDEEQILAGIKKKQRAGIRNALKNDLSFRVDQDTTTAYKIYSESVRNLGTPVFAAHYFGALQYVFGDKCDVLTVEHQGKAVSSVLSFYYKGQVLPYYGGGLDEARALKSNDYMYYQLMCSAKSSRQSSYFDFGRSKDDSGAYKYKKTWGMEPQPLHYMFYLVNATELPNLSPNNPKYQFFIQMWKKLPVAISRLIGPFLSKYLG
mgnify:CR=1 FL=1